MVFEEGAQSDTTTADGTAQGKNWLEIHVQDSVVHDFIPTGEGTAAPCGPVEVTTTQHCYIAKIFLPKFEIPWMYVSYGMNSRE